MIEIKLLCFKIIELKIIKFKIFQFRTFDLEMICIVLKRSTKTSAKVYRVEAWTFVCCETSSSLAKGLITPTRSSDHKLAVDWYRFRPCYDLLWFLVNRCLFSSVFTKFFLHLIRELLKSYITALCLNNLYSTYQGRS